MTVPAAFATVLVPDHVALAIFEVAAPGLTMMFWVSAETPRGKKASLPQVGPCWAAIPTAQRGTPATLTRFSTLRTGDNDGGEACPGACAVMESTPYGSGVTCERHHKYAPTPKSARSASENMLSELSMSGSRSDDVRIVVPGDLHLPKRVNDGFSVGLRSDRE